jgi:hypothetical protein
MALQGQIKKHTTQVEKKKRKKCIKKINKLNTTTQGADSGNIT